VLDYISIKSEDLPENLPPPRFLDRESYATFVVDRRQVGGTTVEAWKILCLTGRDGTIYLE